jgi:hypothetical protein
MVLLFLISKKKMKIALYFIYLLNFERAVEVMMILIRIYHVDC